MVVNQEQVPAHLHSRDSTEPIVISKPAQLLKDAYERIVPHAIWAVQHGCQRLVVMLNDTDTVMRLLHFTHTLVRDNLKKLYIEFGTSEKRERLPLHREWPTIAIVIAQVEEYILLGWAGARYKS